MAIKKYTRQELEDILTKRYLGHIIRFTYPGKEPVNGMCSNVAFTHEGELSLAINDLRYVCSVESINDCIKIIRQ